MKNPTTPPFPTANLPPDRNPHCGRGEAFFLDKTLKFAFNMTGLINAWKIDIVLTPESDWKSHESCPKFHPGAGKHKSAETFREKVKSYLFDKLVT